MSPGERSEDAIRRAVLTHRIRILTLSLAALTVALVAYRIFDMSGGWQRVLPPEWAVEKK
ncbi:MAG: hypothetical protein BGO01_04300 [Armatimonadetes bacterium 55-13]|nr:hypothetical protein [Armatimonadota bacterium]OJU63370.1 MAG: hypothetical protein BGO01_04300 [Armatimonadetes bacterium 55-13]